MLPDISLRIENLIKAMETIVQPAVDPENDLAQEQAQLMIGHLKLLNSQWDMAYLYEMRALEESVALANALIAAAEGGPETNAAKEALVAKVGAVPEQKPHTAEAVNRYTSTIGEAIDTLIYACHDDGSQNFREKLHPIMLEAGEKQIMRERVWFQATGLDPEKDQLPSIEEMLLNG